MAYDRLDVAQKTVLQEAARVAYGSGMFEGRAGGKGRMGILRDADGKTRIVKFNTHLSERMSHSPVTEQMRESSNSLRTALLDIARSAGVEHLGAIRNRLGLTPDGMDDHSSKLLSRSDVAAVVRMIGGEEVWDDALANVDMGDYESDEDTRFNTVAKGLSERSITLPGTRFDFLSDQDVDDCLGKAQAEFTGFLMGLVGKDDDRQSEIFEAVFKNVVNKEFIKEMAFSGGCTREDILNFPKKLATYIEHDFPELSSIVGDDVEAMADILRTACRCMMTDEGSLLGYGLNREQVAQLKSRKLMPVDCLTYVKKTFPGLSGDELWKVAKSVSVHAHARISAGGSSEVETAVKGVKEDLEFGRYQGLYIGAFLVQTGHDIDRCLREFVDHGEIECYGQKLNRVGLDSCAGVLWLSYDRAKKVLFAGMDGKESWRVFCEMIAPSVELFSDADTPPFKAMKKIGQVMPCLDPAELAVCREKGVDMIRVLMKVTGGKHVANAHLLARFVENGDEPFDMDDLAKRIDAFWTAVTPKAVLGAGNENLDNAHMAIFQHVAACYPEAVDNPAKRQEIAVQYQKVMGLIDEMTEAFPNVEDASIRERILDAFLPPNVVNQRALLNAVQNQQLDDLKEKGLNNVRAYANVLTEVDDLVRFIGDNKSPNIGMPTDLKTKFIAPTQPQLLANLFGVNYKKLSDRIKTRKVLVETYVEKYNQASLLTCGGEREARATRLASYVVLKCLAGMGSKMLSKPIQHETLFKTVYDLCMEEGEDGIVQRIDACSRSVQDELKKSKPDENSIKQAILPLLKGLAQSIFVSCFNRDDPEIRKTIYDGEYIEPDEMQEGLADAMSALVESDSWLVGGISLTMDEGAVENDVQNCYTSLADKNLTHNSAATVLMIRGLLKKVKG